MDNYKDERLDEAISIVQKEKRASFPLLQRRMKIGYRRAILLIEELEKMGLIGPYRENQPREVFEGVSK